MSTSSRGVRAVARTGAISRKTLVVRHLPFRCLRPSILNQSQCIYDFGSRTYSTSHVWQQSVQGDGVLNDIDNDLDVALEDELLAIQDASIAELETKLGKSLEDAVEQDRYGADVQAVTDHIDNDALEEDLEEDSSELAILELREQGASHEEIAGEARRLFGDYLRSDTLTEDELVYYKRMYGKPLVHPDEYDYEELDEEEQPEPEQVPDNVLLDQAGGEVSYRLENASQIAAKMAEQASPGTDSEQNVSTGMLPYAPAPADAERAAEVASLLEGELYDEDNYDFDEETEDTRSHPLTSLGRFATQPRTTFMPKETFVHPIEGVLSDYSNRHLKEACERAFGGPGLPDSPLTPRLAKARQQLPIPLLADQQSMGQGEANAFVSTIMPPTYASISASLVEVRKRLGASWLNKLLAKPGGPRVLDAGSGGVGIVAWREILQAHWNSLHTSDKKPPKVPETKSVVLTGSDNLRHRATKLVENTTFVPRLPDVAGTRQAPTLEDDRPAQQRKQFDVIIASHSLFPLREEWERKQHVQNLWSLLSDDGGVLIILEKGIPRGFETVAAAREQILENYLAIPDGHKTDYSVDAQDQPLKGAPHKKSPGMIVAPCTNHDRCPMYRTTGVSHGRKDICSFQQRYIRPPFLQNILGAKDRNHDDVDFSYISFLKGKDLRTRTFSTWEHVNDPLSAPPSTQTVNTVKSQQKISSRIQTGFEHYDPTFSTSHSPPPTHTLPRILGHPLKRKGHVTIDLCTPQAEIRRWLIPKSFSRQAYRDARKARWGDLWALGAKTNIPKNLKVGTPAKEMEKGEGLRKPRSRKERLEAKIAQALEAEQDEMEAEDEEEAAFDRMVEEDNLLDEDDDELIDMDELVPKKRGKKQSHAKLDGVNLFPRKSAGRSETRSNVAPKTPAGGRKAEPLVSEQPDNYNANRYGETEKEAFSDWAAELDGAMLGDEARKRLAKEGRRATSKNTFRKKRDLRREQRKQGNTQL